MITSISLNGSTSIKYLRVLIDPLTKKTRIYDSTLELCDAGMEEIQKNHRIFIPCVITDDCNGGVINVPFHCDTQTIESYTQAFLDELLLYRKKVANSKSLEQIQYDFKLEILVF